MSGRCQNRIGLKKKSGLVVVRCCQHYASEGKHPVNCYCLLDGEHVEWEPTSFYRFPRLEDIVFGITLDGRAVNKNGTLVLGQW